MLRTFWMAQEYNLPNVTSSSMRLKGGIRSTSFRQSDRGSLKRTRTLRLKQDDTLWHAEYQDLKRLPYPMLVPSGMTLCQPQSIAYCTDGSRKLLDANFSMVSMPSSRTSALTSCDQAHSTGLL